MDTVYSENHIRHAGRVELYGGRLVPCFEKPERARLVVEQVRSRSLGDIISPQSHGLEPLLRVHSGPYLEFLQTAWSDWCAVHGDTDAPPINWPVRSFSQRVPDSIDGRMGFYSMDAGTPITEGTWEAVKGGADATLTALDRVQSGRAAAFALVRPPGHHAARDFCGGYCYVNNAAVAAQSFIDQTGERVAILDVDYHHGNGTQSIFYDRSDVLFQSVHGDPNQEFPYFLGFADECGSGEGDGFNRNFPLPWGTTAERWFEAVDEALRRINEYKPGLVVVSLGVDAYKGDPISHFLLESADYIRLGERIAGLGLPALFVLEGGYAVDEIGINVVNTLGAFDAACG